jgi:hypothetical protein
VKTNILIEINTDEGIFTGNSRWDDEIFVPNLSFCEADKDKLIALVSESLKTIMNISGTEYISRHSFDDDFVRCPDAFVKLPIDTFCCKHNNECCFIGGGVYKKNKQEFIDNCMIEEKKEGIWNAITTEKYEGFHHVPGRYLCPSCEEKNSTKRINYSYHYPWEMCLIGQFLDYEDIELRKEVIRKGINKNVYYSSFCGACAKEILQKLGISKNFELIETEVYRKSKNDS